MQIEDDSQRQKGDDELERACRNKAEYDPKITLDLFKKKREELTDNEMVPVYLADYFIHATIKRNENETIWDEVPLAVGYLEYIETVRKRTSNRSSNETMERYFKTALVSLIRKIILRMIVDLKVDKVQCFNAIEHYIPSNDLAILGYDKHLQGLLVAQRTVLINMLRLRDPDREEHLVKFQKKARELKSELPWNWVYSALVHYLRGAQEAISAAESNS